MTKCITQTNLTAQYVKGQLDSNMVKLESVNIVLSIDAIDIKLFQKNSDIYTSIFIFYALPTDQDIKGFPVHALLHESGKTTKEVKEITNVIIKAINSVEMCYVPIKVVDGEAGNNPEHRTQFNEFVKIYKTEGFRGLINMIQKNFKEKNKTYIMTDMIHYGKNRRTQVILADLLINKNVVDISPLQNILKNSGSVTDLSSLSKLQDAFPIEMFNFDVVYKLINKEAWNLVLFMLPMSCWLEAALNTELDRNSRLFLIETAFLIYMRIYEIQLENRVYDEMQPQISLIRAMNSLAILYAAFDTDDDDFSFNRHTTTPQENFHGCIRGLLTNNDNYDVILRNIAKAALVYRYKRELDIPTTARTRISVGGIHWNAEIHKLHAIPQQGSLKLQAADVAQFFFAQSSYEFANTNKDAHKRIIQFWVANVSKGTFMLKTTLRAYHGKHILTRQISNSKDLKDRCELSLENDVNESDEGKKAFEEEIEAFSEAMKEEMLTRMF